MRTAGGAIDSNEQTPQAATPWEFYAGGVLIGLAFGDLAAHAVASVPASSPTPGWVSVLCALVATIVAATAAGNAMRLAWLLIAFWAGAHWVIYRHATSTVTVLSGASIQLLAGLAFLAATRAAAASRARRLWPLVVGSAAVLRAATLLLWARALQPRPGIERLWGG